MGTLGSTNTTTQYIDPAGWIDANETWTYSSADGNTGVFTVAADVTTKYAVGMWVKYTQTTVKYGKISNVGTYSGGNTPITIWGGTDYTFANAAVSANSYSPLKAPVGPSLNPDKWDVITTDTGSRSQGSPTANTWYNLGSVNIVVPIGLWLVYYRTDVEVARAAAGVVSVATTLSTANNTESDIDFSCFIESASITAYAGTNYNQKALSLSSKTTYYLNTRTVTASMTNIYNNANNLTKTIVKAVCLF